MSSLHCRRFLLIASVSLLASCGSTVTDPAGTLADANAHSSRHRQSISMLKTSPERDNKDSVDALQGLIYRPGYRSEVRLEGIVLLFEVDRERLVRTTRQRLSRIDEPEWLEVYCDWLGRQQWTPEEKKTINEALVSSWGVWWPIWTDERERPERAALIRLNGSEAVVPLVFELFENSNKASEQGLRNRCWELLHRLEKRDELIELVERTPDGSSNVMMLDLKAAVEDFGTVPYNREEVLWLRKLRQPERAAFWAEAKEAIQAVPEDRRRRLEIRDLPIVVAAYRHRPDLLTASRAQLYQQIESAIAGQRHYYESEPGMPSDGSRRERLYTHKDKLTWGDLAAMSLALEAFSQGPVRAHLFDYADRDKVDEGTEYGGIIQLDDEGRFEVREFLPKIRHNDRRFNASQQMFNAGYTALFHMHYHAQRHNNSRHAGPGLGDLTYADNTRTNNLVFTFVDEDTLGVDFYRHDQVIVDLGTISRPGAG
ncbi:MAG: hypothetical protein MK116_00890 [Phycisphaerales bacterium]|nr:hypothetical protein [Phycisphaerales bacterium]